MLEGLLVDLVPYGKRFEAQEHTWHNSEAWFWATAGDRVIETRAAIDRHHEHRAEHAATSPAPPVWFGIQAKDGTPLGDIAINWSLPHHRVGMLGAAIGEPGYWGGGYGTDALLLMLDYAFDWLDYHKLWLGTMALNARVLRQMEKVGFRQEARLRDEWYVDGRWQDGVLFGMLQTEWSGRAAMIDRLGLQAR
jgi:RimJ/RimL family protein N-acetyltransferase